MIRVKKNKIFFTGKDAKQIASISKQLGLSLPNCVTGMLWEMIMKMAREGAFRNEQIGSL